MSKASVRAEALADFSEATGCPALARIIQRGRNPESARFTLELDDGREVRVGTIKTFWSQTELAKVVAVACGVVLSPVKSGDWREMLAVLIAGCVDVEEVDGEAFEDAVEEWLTEYLATTTLDVDRDGAVRQSAPFRAGGLVHIAAGHFAKYVRRDQGEVIATADLRQALADLGFERKAINYQRGKVRSSKSYYVTDEANLTPPEGA